MRRNYPLQFLLIGVLLFILNAIINKNNDSPKRIIVSQNDVIQMMNNWQQTFGSAPDEAEVDELIKKYIKEEIYVRKALSHSLEKHDPLIRKLLSDRYEYLMADQIQNFTFDSIALIHFYEDNIQLYTDSFYTFFQFPISFSDFKAKHNNYQEFAKHLVNQPDTTSLNIDSSFHFLPFKSVDANYLKVVQTFGSAFADSLTQSQFEIWSGPFRSGYAYHLIYLTDVKHKVKSFKHAVNQVNEDLLYSKKYDWQDSLFQQAKTDYQIIVDTFNFHKTYFYD